MAEMNGTFGLGVLILTLFSMMNVSFAYNWANGQGVQYALGCDFYGNDIRNVSSSGQDCGCICARDTNCDHFTWSSNGMCWLKRANNPAAVDANGAVCGWVTDRTQCQGISYLFLPVSLLSFNVWSFKEEDLYQVVPN